MSILSRVAYHQSTTLKLNVGINHVHRFVRGLQSTATDSTPQTMYLDSENQQEDLGY